MYRNKISYFFKNIVDFQLPLTGFGIFKPLFGKINTFNKRNIKKVKIENNDVQQVLIDNFGQNNVLDKNIDNKSVIIEKDIFKQSVFKVNENNVIDFDKNNFVVDKMNLKEAKTIMAKCLFGVDIDNDEMGDKTVLENVKSVNTGKRVKPPKIFDNITDNLFLSCDGKLLLSIEFCPFCGGYDLGIHEYVDTEILNEFGEKIYVKRAGYKCKNCGEYFLIPNPQCINLEEMKKIDYDDIIRKIHAVTGLSYDKIAEIMEFTLNITISHEYIRKVIQQKQDNWQYEEKLVELPQDYNKKEHTYDKKRKTSKERGVTDLSYLHMAKRNDINISGEVTVDEIFLTMVNHRKYLVVVCANEIKDKPIAFGILDTRFFNVMKTFFDFVFSDISLKALSTDMLRVYGKLAEHYDIDHQLCKFHAIKYTSDLIFKELKKNKELSDTDKIFYTNILSQYCEILRQIDEKEAVELYNKFLKETENCDNLTGKIRKSLIEKFNKLITFMKNPKISSTSNQCENWNSRPENRNMKVKAKKPMSLIYTLTSMTNYYKPLKRTLRLRERIQNLLQQPDIY
jgi:hypothetical protein